MGDDNFTRSRKMRKQQRRPPIGRGQSNATTHRAKEVWEKKRPEGRATQNGQGRINSQRRRNGDAKPVRSPHAR